MWLWCAVHQVAGAGAKAAQAVVANRVELLGAATSLLYFLSVAKVAERAEAVEVAVGEHGRRLGALERTQDLLQEDLRAATATLTERLRRLERRAARSQGDSSSSPASSPDSGDWRRMVAAVGVAGEDIAPVPDGQPEPADEEELTYSDASDDWAAGPFGWVDPSVEMGVSTIAEAEAETEARLMGEARPRSVPGGPERSLSW